CAISPMPKQLATDLLERVAAQLAGSAGGRTLAELEALLEGVASRRTLQRRLDEWVRSGALRAEGVRRGRGYFTVTIHPVGIAEPPAGRYAPDIQATIPVSTQGQEIQALVQRPIADRLPVGYQKEFLERYVPNRTVYLTEALRSHLHSLGYTPEGHRP